MEIFQSLNTNRFKYQQSSLAIGNFDAIHLGHQLIISKCVREARAKGVKCGLITFDPHPTEVLRKRPYIFVNNYNERMNILKSLGLDFVYIFKFDNIFASIPAEDFIKKYIFEIFNPTSIFTGSNFQFGHNRLGNKDMLKALSAEYKYNYYPVEEVNLGNIPISTSEIKRHLACGSIILANNMLGRNICYEGTVIYGMKLASAKLSCPTANMDTNFENSTEPLHGVYLASIYINDTKYYGILNLGQKPTVAENKKCSIEVHIFDFNQNIYGKVIKVSLLAFIRPERQFKDLESLKYQIEADIKLAKYSLKNLNHHHLKVE